MLDKFLEVAYQHEKTARDNRELVELLEQLPRDELVRVASGTSELNKVAYCSPCGDGSWLDRFKGSPLFEQAMAIEQQLLELEMAEAEKRQNDQATWNARDKLNVQKRMLDLQLAQQDNGGEAPVLAPSVEQPELGQEPAAPAAPAPAPSRVEVKTAGHDKWLKALQDASQQKADRWMAAKVIKHTARAAQARRAAHSGQAAQLARSTMQKAMQLKTAAELTEAAREKIKSKNFAISAKKSGTGEPAYPIHDKRHASNALARVKQHGTSAEKSEVYKDVAKKFPELAARSDVPAVRAKAKTAEDAYAERFRAALAKEAALPRALLERARSIKDVAATKSPLTEVSFKSLLGKGTSSGPGRELAFKSLAKKAALSKEAIGFMGAAKGLIGAAKRGYGAGGLSGAAADAGKMFGRVARSNPLAAAGLVAAPVAAAGLGMGALAGRASA